MCKPSWLVLFFLSFLPLIPASIQMLILFIRSSLFSMPIVISITFFFFLPSASCLREGKVLRFSSKYGRYLVFTLTCVSRVSLVDEHPLLRLFFLLSLYLELLSGLVIGRKNKLSVRSSCRMTSCDFSITRQSVSLLLHDSRL